MLLDLGSCRGTFGISLQKIMPDLSIVCVDNSFIRVATSMFRKPLFAKGPKFLYGDLFKTSISNVDILNVYLPQEMTKTLIDKIRAESRSTTIVVMYRIELEDLPYKERIYLGRPSEIRNRVTVYEF
ncbi:hypothetical protein [Bradyrhizobium cytisi]|uniref:Class I SAM-dependent methyltransferase n=1 Tax=Bradyrhizobium cytisi TaxID=515489 RepID=A0A5S4X092_9BRAD|nr:hypothetical protein [Bradyrhizobium cytisi]TYL86310.1 hypothetical protein FXB38_07460 [Bradyrhizobium cytisi]